MKKAVILISYCILFNFCSYSQNASIKTGIEMLEEQNFRLLEGKRVGLITNPTGINSQMKSTVDILYEAENVKLVALFGPEHGVRGNFSAGDKIDQIVDPKTKLPVHSLYGKTRKPTDEMLENIDVLVYDIQDIGSRSYTYISTMGLAMEAAAENNKEFIVLDRPNPLGGNKVEGCIVEDGYFSFVSQYPIPYVYGLTPGELAGYINEEHLLANGIKCKLQVVKMKGWTRNMNFQETGLPWVPTSPHIPRDNSAYFYAISGILGELDANMIGVGYTLPFEIFAVEKGDADLIAQKMNDLKLEGILFRPIYFKPYYMKNSGKEYGGVQVYLTDFEKAHLTSVQFYFAQVIHEICPENDIFGKAVDRYNMFDKVTGTKEIREKFVKNYKYDDIKAKWDDNKNFKETAKKYFLYK